MSNPNNIIPIVVAATAITAITANLIFAGIFKDPVSDTTVIFNNNSGYTSMEVKGFPHEKISYKELSEKANLGKALRKAVSHAVTTVGMIKNSNGYEEIKNPDNQNYKPDAATVMAELESSIRDAQNGFTHDKTLKVVDDLERVISILNGTDVDTPALEYASVMNNKNALGIKTARGYEKLYSAIDKKLEVIVSDPAVKKRFGL